MIGMILCGGMGKRLRPLTSSKPKALLEIKRGYTILDRQILQYSSAGIETVFLLTGHLGKKIEGQLGRERFGVRIEYVRERKPLGTLNAIRLGMRKAGEDVMVTNGDVVCDLNMQKMREEWEKSGAWGSMYVVRMRSPYGIVKTSGRWIAGFIEKPLLNHYINGGVYCLSRRVLPVLEKYKIGDIEKTAFPELAAKRKLVWYKEDGIYWASIDSVKDLEAVRKEYANRTDAVWGYKKSLGNTEVLHVMAGKTLRFSSKRNRILVVKEGRGKITSKGTARVLVPGNRVKIKKGVPITIEARRNLWMEEKAD